jgi:hypothetical protein
MKQVIGHGTYKLHNFSLKEWDDYFTEADPPISLESDPPLTGVNG